MLKYKYHCLHPNEKITIHVERLTYPSKIKDMILRSLKTKSVILDWRRGPDIVEKGILSILRELDLSGSNSVDWVLNVDSKESWEKLILNREKLVVGPNIEFGKPHISRRLKEYDDFKILSPSAWVIPIIQERLNWFKGQFFILPSGIDFRYWKPPKDRRNDRVLIYRKFDDSETDFLNVVGICNFLGLEYEVVTYGSYTRGSFRRVLRNCRAAIWLGTSESQGIALLECWAMNIPTLVRRQESYEDKFTGKVFASSSAPYMVQECGQDFSASQLDIKLISSFLTDLINMGPRDYVVSEFSAAKSLEKLHTILTK